MLFNSIIPEVMPFQNRDMKKKALSELVFEAYRRSAGLSGTVAFLDRLKEFGFRYATMEVSPSASRISDIPAKETLLEEAGPASSVPARLPDGQHHGGERYNKVIDTWTHANNDIADAMVKAMSKSKNGFNPVFMMFDSGSRGSRDQIRQLAGMRGLMASRRRSSPAASARSSRARSSRTSAKASRCSSTSSRRTARGSGRHRAQDGGRRTSTRRPVDVAQDVTITERIAAPSSGSRSGH